ncbi:MAG: class I SAM-dependent methyltransferase [Chloroflexi bacterium]|nr:class I SAM-dependent methyltransferase [Chloroflexota bacterium]
MVHDERRLLDEQVRYYQARAAEYDTTTTPAGDLFAPHGDATRAALRAFEPVGDVLELAAGTGQWTRILAEHATTVTAVDASPEMLEINRAKVADPTVRYLVADLFAWKPPQDYDVVFFGFFLSHVPPGHFDAFWSLVARCLRPGGRAFFVDERDHGAWNEDWADRPAGVVHRTLVDGSQHRAVKVLWRPDDLASRLADLGWDASVTGAGPFYWGRASR